MRLSKLFSSVVVSISALLACAGLAKGDNTLQFEEETSKTVHVQLGIQSLRDQPGCHGELHNFMVDALHPYSALRDKKLGKVEVFFDAERWLVQEWDQCIFAKDVWNWWDSGNYISVKGSLRFTSDRARRFEGFTLECDDPGEEYSKVIFTQNSYDYTCGLKSVPLQSIAVAEDGPVGVCVASLFSQRPIFTPWLEYTVALGVDRIHVYFQHIYNEVAIDGFYGPRWNSDLQKPFQPITNPSVVYYNLKSPTHRHEQGQTTILNECVFRNRHAHNYLIMADVDEFLHIRHPGQTLEASISAFLQNDSAAIMLDTVNFALDCFPNSTQEAKSTGKLFAETIDHFDWKAIRSGNSKTIISPLRVLTCSVHWVQLPREGYKANTAVSVRNMYFKHIKTGNNNCEALSNEWVDENDPAAFESAVTRKEQEEARSKARKRAN